MNFHCYRDAPQEISIRYSHARHMMKGPL